MKFVCIVMELEEELGVEVPDDEIRHAVTLGDVYAVFTHRLSAAQRQEFGAATPDRRIVLAAPSQDDAVWATIARVVAQWVRVNPDQLRPEMRVVDDLAID